MTPLPYRFLISALGISLLAGCTPDSRNDEPPSPDVLFSFPVLELAVRDIIPAGSSTRVFLPANASPHGFEPDPSDVAMLESASILLLAHPDLDGWIARFAPEVSQYFWEDEPDTSSALPDEHEGHNAHYWTDPRRVQEALPGVVEALCGALNGACDEMRLRGDSLSVRIDTLVSQQIRRIADANIAPVMTSHPFLDHFLDRFGIPSAGSIRPVPGQDPRPATLSATLSRAQEAGVQILLVEKSVDPTTLSTLVRDAGLRIVEIDPLGYDADSYEGYIEHLVDAVTGSYSPSP